MSRRWLSILPLRLRSIFRRSAVERELDEELRFHLEARIQQEIELGRTREEARAIAMGSMDGLEGKKEECRDMRQVNLIEDLLRDIRYALRTLARSRGFTATALLALTLGIGANSAVFSVVSGVLLRPLPFANPDRLMMLFNSRPSLGIQRGGASVADFLDWRERSRSFQTIDVFEFNRFTNGRFTWTGDGHDPEQVVGLSVSATFFETLGVRPLIGAGFAAGDDQPGKPSTVVVSERLWRKRYGASPSVIGTQVTLNGRTHAVVGVMPASFEFWQSDVEAWAILPLVPPTRRGPFFLRGIARLKPGVTHQQAESEMSLIAQGVAQANPNDQAGLRYLVVPLREVTVGDVRLLLWVLTGAVALVFLISIANVANLSLARATARRREITLRLSLGAGHGQLVRQFMTESALLALAGGAAGIGLAQLGVMTLRFLEPSGLPRLNEIVIDTRVLLFTLAASLLSAVLFGLAPALGTANAALNERLKDGDRTGESKSRGLARGGLVIVQVMFSVLLLIGSGLLIRSFSLLSNVSPGFNAPPDQVLTMFVSPTGPRFSNGRRAVESYWNELVERIRALPGVEAASVANSAPPNRFAFRDTYEIEGRPLPPGSRNPSVPMPIVSHDYFKVLGVPLLRGRWFDQTDSATSRRVAVISESLARRHFQGENPIGQHIKHGQSSEIVGVVGDVKYNGLDGETAPVMYQLSAQWELWDLWLLVRTRGDAAVLASTVRDEIRRLNPDVPVDRISTIEQSTSDSVSMPRFRSLLMTVFAVTALLLAAIGIYGVVSYSVAQRTREIGLRMAIGATQGKVLRQVVGDGSRLALIGIALGLAGSAALTNVLRGLLYGVTPSDGLTFVSATVILGTVALAASLIPAWRASRIDPVTALRQD